MDGTLSKIGIIDLAERASHLPVNRMVYIYGREDISAGETLRAHGYGYLRDTDVSVVLSGLYPLQGGLL